MIANSLIGGHYRVIDVLGSGTYGDVYKVQDITDGGRMKAVKTVKLDEGTEEEVMTEVNILHKLDPVDGVVKVLDLFYLNEKLAIVQEILLSDLHDLADASMFSPALTAKTGMKLMQIIKAVHGFGILHRDIKMANIMVSGDFSNPQLKLIDFGMSFEFIKDGVRKETPKNDYEYAAVDYTSVRLANKKNAHEIDDVYMIGYAVMAMRYLQIFTGKTADQKTEKKEDFHKEPWKYLTGKNRFLVGPWKVIARQKDTKAPAYGSIIAAFKNAAKFDPKSPLKLVYNVDGKLCLSV